MKKTILYLAYVILTAFGLASCMSMKIEDEGESSFDYLNFIAVDASASLNGPSETPGIFAYGLEMVQGRIDSDGKLVSNGGFVHIEMKGPFTDPVALPQGTYRIAAEAGPAFTFTPGTVRSGMVEGTRISVMGPKDKKPAVIPVVDGTIEVDLEDGDKYRITCMLIAGGDTFSFGYTGYIDIE